MEVTLDGWGLIITLLGIAAGVSYFFLQLHWSVRQLIDVIKTLDEHQTTEHDTLLKVMEKRLDLIEKRLHELDKEIDDLGKQMTSHDAKYDARSQK